MFELAADIVVHGDIRVNGTSASSSYMRRHSGFMHQEDMFIETMTVFEHIWFMVRLYSSSLSVTCATSLIFIRLEWN